MGFRLRRSVTLLPGLRLNLGLSGVSLSAGPRGASLNLGSRGLYGNVGLPGTGVSYRHRLRVPGVADMAFQSAAELPGARVEGRTVRMTMQLDLDAQGRLTIRDADGALLEPALERRLRREHEPQLRAWLEERERQIDDGFEAMTSVHWSTPAPVWVSPFVRDAFTAPEPIAPEPPAIGFWDRLWSARRHAKESAHAEAQAAFAQAHAAWTTARAAHESRESAEAAAFEHAVRNDPDVMEEVLEHAFDAITWPRETRLRFALDDTAHTLLLDVDLPEVERVPARDAAMAARGLKLNIRERSVVQVRRAYAQHVHGVLFRAAGVAFATLPALQELVVSGYSQRRDPQTANLRDEYLVSTRIERVAWERIDFTALEHLDVMAYFEAFECVRHVSASGRFDAIEPLARLEQLLAARGAPRDDPSSGTTALG